MAAPLALLAGEKLAQAVSNDLVVLNGRLYRTVRVGRKKVLEPVDIQVHVNPVSVGLGLLGGAVGLFAADLAWNGIHFGFPGLEFDLVKGLKDSPYWQGVVDKLTRGKAGTPGPIPLPISQISSQPNAGTREPGRPPTGLGPQPVPGLEGKYPAYDLSQFTAAARALRREQRR